MRRRTLLKTAGGATALALVAGCVGSDSETDDGTGDDGATDDGASTDGYGDEDGTEGGELSTEINEVGSRSLEGEEENDDGRLTEPEASVQFANGAVEIEGKIEAPTPCNDAIITSVDESDEMVTVHIGLEPTDEVCIQVVEEELEYEAEIELEDSTIESVTVVHEDRVGETTVLDRISIE